MCRMCVASLVIAAAISDGRELTGRKAFERERSVGRRQVDRDRPARICPHGRQQKLDAALHDRVFLAAHARQAHHDECRHERRSQETVVGRLQLFQEASVLLRRL